MMVFIAFFHSIILARFLGPELKGIHATIYSIMSLGAVVIYMSSQQAYPYFRKKYGYAKYFNKFMSFTIVYHTIIIILTGIVSCFLFKISYIIALSMILIPISSFSTTLGYICLVELPRTRNKALVMIDIIDTLFLIILFLVASSNIIYLFIIMVSPLVLKIVYFVYKNKFKFTLECFSKEFVIELFKFSLLPMISMLLTMLNYKIDILMLKACNNIELSDIGIYSIGVSLADKAVYIPDAVKEILLSKLSKGSGPYEVARTMRFCFPISILIGIVILLIGEPILNLLYGKDYLGSYTITVICIFGTAMMVFFKMISQYNNVNGKQKINVIFLIIAIILNIILNIVMIPIWGITGAALASLISYIICAILFMIYFKKTTKIEIRKMIFPIKEDLKKVKELLINNRK